MTTPMPKDNEVDEKARPVAWIVTNGGESCEPWLEYEQSEVDALPAVCIAEPLYSAATVAELRAEVERLRADAYKFRRLARLLDGFDFRLGRNVLMPPATYLDSVEITCEFQPGVGQSVIDAIMDTLTGADPT